MSIMAQCGACQKQFKLDDKLAGRKVRCKGCGGVIVVPAPAREPEPAGDPFDNLDSLMSLEQGGTVQEAPPPSSRCGRRGAAVARPADERPVDDKLAPTHESPRVKMRRAGAAEPAAAAPRVRRPYHVDYLSIPGEDAIDRWVPLASICVVIVLLFMPMFILVREMVTLPSDMKINWHGVGELVGLWARGAGLTAAFVFGLLAGMVALAVHVGSVILKFDKPANLYRRSASVICAPTLVPMTVITIKYFSPAFEPPSMALIVALCVAVLFVTLWLMFRLRLAQYAVSAGFTLLFVGIGSALFFMLVVDLTSGHSIFAPRLSPGPPRHAMHVIPMG